MLCRVNHKEFLFLSVWAVYLTTILLELTVLTSVEAVDSALKYIRYICYLIAALKILWDCYLGKQVWKVCIVAFLITLMAFSSENREFLFYFYILIAAKDVNCCKIIRTAFYVQGFILALFVVGSQVGVIEDYLFDATSRVRHGLGFDWTTTAPILFFFFMMSYIYLRKERMRWYEFLILEVINYWFYIMTDTRFSFYLSSLMLAYIFVMRYYWQNKRDRIRKNQWLVFAPAVFCVIAILLHVFYNSENAAWNSLNNILSGRLALGKSAWDEYGLTLFGQTIRWIGYGWSSSGGTYNYVDCSYMQILLECGVVFLILVVLAYTCIMQMAIKRKDYYLQTILFVIVIFSITEPRLMNLRFNPFPMLVIAGMGVDNTRDLFEKESVLIRGIRLRRTQIKLKNRC